MKASVYKLDGKKSSDINLSDDVFGVSWNPDLVHQVFVAHRANKRQMAGHVKDRSEVRGGGRKPWRQKGTGRARHGSNRSPIWIGGGVTFGPNRNRKLTKDINKKQKQAALFSLLSKKYEEGEVLIVDSFKLDEYKTKNANQALKALLKDKRMNALLIASDENREIKSAVRNIEDVDAVSGKSLNVCDLLTYKFLIIEKDVLEIIEDHYKSRSKTEMVAAK